MAHVVASSKQIRPECWMRLLSGHAKDYRYYETVEETLPQFDYRYFILENDRSGAVTIQPFFFVVQDLTVGLPKSLRKIVGMARKIWPRFLSLKMMMVGCAAGEGQLDSTELWAVEALHEAMNSYARGKASIILLKDFPSDYRSALATFLDNDYKRVPSMPAAKLDLEFTSFEDYMQRKLGKVFRKNLRRKLRETKDVELTMEVVSDVTPIVDDIYSLYLQTFQRSEFQFEELTREYLCMLGQRMPDRVRYFLWRQNGRIIAFNLCLVHEDTIYDLNVGMDYAVSLDLQMYFVTWRDVVQWAMEHGLKRYHTGPLNYDPKLHLRLDLAPQDLYARHTSPLFNPLFKIAIQYLEPTRHDATIQRFHNAHEL